MRCKGFESGLIRPFCLARRLSDGRVVKLLFQLIAGRVGFDARKRFAVETLEPSLARLLP